jgi:4,5-dihydroxyphthalate decarboxylase
MLQMLEAGEIDAAVLGAPPADKPYIKPVFADPVQDSRDWYARHRVIQINHMIVLKRSLVEAHPDFPQAMMTLLGESAGSNLSEADRLAHPRGLSQVRPHLDHAIDMVHRQGLTRARLPLESFFHPATLID